MRQTLELKSSFCEWNIQTTSASYFKDKNVTTDGNVTQTLSRDQIYGELGRFLISNMSL